MQVVGDRVEPWWCDRGVWLGLGVVAAVAGLDVVARVQLTGAYATGAIVAGMVASARRTAAVGVVAVVVSLAGGVWSGNLGEREWLVRTFMCVVLAALAVTSATVRERREARLRRLRTIAETAQRALLRPVPPVVGRFRVATRYLSAARDTTVGGDLYDVALTADGRLRLVVGDVRGKGLEAVQTAGAVLAAWRQAALGEPDPAAVAATVDDLVGRLLEEEEFVTALFVELDATPGAATAAVASCGHHPPLVVAPDGAWLLETDHATTPLGLDPRPAVDRHPLPPGSRVLLYTDGLVEHRDERGTFFPLLEEAGALRGRALDAALDELLVRLHAFGHGHVSGGDDVALVLVEVG